jgi:hypothetical protein
VTSLFERSILAVAVNAVAEIAKRATFFFVAPGKGFIVQFGESLSDIKGCEVSHV